MVSVARLVTLADVNDVGDPRSMSIAVRHEAELTDGRRIPLLTDRGWSSHLSTAGAGPGKAPDIWAMTTARDIAKTSRMVVGPDEAYDGHTQQEMDAYHWESLADMLRSAGVAATARRLRELPHEVVLSERIRARLRS